MWIYGGGYVIGGSSGRGGDGSALARQGLVVVSLNYRLGRLGFFAHPALIAESGGADRYSGISARRSDSGRSTGCTPTSANLAETTAR